MNTMKTRLNMRFILVLPVKVEFAAMLRMLNRARGCDQQICPNTLIGVNDPEFGEKNQFLELPQAMTGS